MAKRYFNAILYFLEMQNLFLEIYDSFLKAQFLRKLA